MGRLVFITGGARSGKSRFAVQLAKELGGKIVFIATCVPRDREMKERVKRHKRQRPKHWKTIEEEADVASVLRKLNRKCGAVVIDCLTLLVSNLLLAGNSEQEILRQAEGMVRAVLKSSFTAILVSNEVGSGIVPESELGRKFRDIAGRANQICARRAREVYLLVSGIPLKIRGQKR